MAKRPSQKIRETLSDLARALEGIDASLIHLLKGFGTAGE
jgi:hypothetical protein